MNRPIILLDEAQESQFWRKVQKDGDHWLWTGARQSRQGHGLLRLNGWMVGAHRVAWTLTRGDIPFEHRLIHTCGLKHCVNPDHLKLVDPRAKSEGNSSHADCDHDNTRAARKACLKKRKEGN